MNNRSEPSAAVKRRRRHGVDWTVLVQLVAMAPSLLVGLGIVVLVDLPGPGICPQQAGVDAQWAPFGAAALWFILGFVWFAPFLQSFLAIPRPVAAGSSSNTPVQAV